MTKRVIIVDKNIVNWGGHFLQYAMDIAAMYKREGATVELVVNKYFGRGVFKLRPAEAESIEELGKVHRVLQRFVFHKKLHPYEKLPKPPKGLSVAFKNWLQKPGTKRGIMHYAIAEFRAGHIKSLRELTFFVANHMNVFDILLAALTSPVWLIMLAIDRRLKPKVEEPEEKQQTRLGLWAGLITARATSAPVTKSGFSSKVTTAERLINEGAVFRRNVGRYRAAMRKLRPGKDDVLVFQTADLDEMRILEALVKTDPSLAEASYKVIIRPPIWHREGNLVEAPEATKQISRSLVALSGLIRNFNYYVETEEIADQFREVGLGRVRVIPILYGEHSGAELDAALNAPPQPFVPGSRPLVALRSGRAHREKGYLLLPDLLKAAQIERAHGGPEIHFNVHAFMTRYERRSDEIIGTTNRMKWFRDGDVKFANKEMSNEQYMADLVGCDIVLAINRHIFYSHGASGTTIEALRAGKPFVVYGENWGGRILRNQNVFIQYLKDFADKTAVARLPLNSITSTSLSLTSHDPSLWAGWEPFRNTEWSQLSFDVARRVLFPVKEDVTHVIVHVKNGGLRMPGDLLKVGLRAFRDSKSLRAAQAQAPQYAYIDPTTSQHSWRYFGGLPLETANIWKLPSGTLQLDISVVLLDRRCDIGNVEVEIILCSEPTGTLPISAGGVMVDTSYEVAEGVFEVGKHMDHYAATARTAGKVMAKIHNAEAYWLAFTNQQLLGDMNEVQARVEAEDALAKTLVMN